MSPSTRLKSALLITGILIQLLQVTSAQGNINSGSTTSSTTSPSSTTFSRSKVHVIEVGLAGDHQFVPNVTSAAIGDIVSFRFHPTNHSVVRGEYVGTNACTIGGCNPCVPYELIHPDQKEKGFHSENVLTETSWSPSSEVILDRNYVSAAASNMNSERHL
jgi:hypothetical protein